MKQMDIEYIGGDGLKRCSKCNGRLEIIVKFNGTYRKVKCVCSCMQEEREKYNKMMDGRVKEFIGSEWRAEHGNR